MEPEVDPHGRSVSMETDALKAPERVCVSVGECEGRGVGLPAYLVTPSSRQRPDWERFSGAGMSGGSGMSGGMSGGSGSCRPDRSPCEV